MRDNPYFEHCQTLETEIARLRQALGDVAAQPFDTTDAMRDFAANALKEPAPPPVQTMVRDEPPTDAAAVNQSFTMQAETGVYQAEVMPAGPAGDGNSQRSPITAATPIDVSGTT